MQTSENIQYEFKGKLIRAGGDAKTIKGNSDGYFTAIMYMTPYKVMVDDNLFNSCSMAVLAGCLEACLNTAGRGQMSNVQNAREKKAQWFYKDRSSFMDQLFKDCKSFITFCSKRDLKPAIRLNGTTDIRWELIKHNGKTIFDAFPEVIFYDYTKIANRKLDIPNYHLTFSYSASNEKYLDQCAIAKKRGMNLAVVFRDRENIPTSFYGLPTFDGDKTDQRFLDPNQVIVALYAKGKAKKDFTGFVQDIAV